MNRAPTLGERIQTYKAASTCIIRQTANPDFAWQRNYYEHIIRNEESLNRTREYILENPFRWAVDRENRDKGIRQGRNLLRLGLSKKKLPKKPATATVIARGRAKLSPLFKIANDYCGDRRCNNQQGIYTIGGAWWKKFRLISTC